MYVETFSGSASVFDFVITKLSDAWIADTVVATNKKK